MLTLRITALAALSLSLAACSGSGGSGGGLFPGMTACDPGTSVQLARPSPGQSNVGSINSIEIVANSNGNALGQNYQNWYLQVQSGFSGTLTGGALNAVPDPSGPHPYASDFFYSSSFGNLPPGVTYTVYLAENVSCQPINIGTFST